MNTRTNIPKGRFAADYADLAAKRAALKAKHLPGALYKISYVGNITLKGNDSGTGIGGTKNTTISIPEGKLARHWHETNPALAANDDDLEEKRAALKAKLLSGDKISIIGGVGKNTVKGDDNATGIGGTKNTTISSPKYKLARQLHETNPTLLQADKEAMVPVNEPNDIK